MSDFLWVEKYRPRKISDCILSEDLKSTFLKFLDNKELPNLLLSGTAGTGKTTVARALCEELGVDYIIINGSDEGRHIDTLRTTIKNFASSVSLDGNSNHLFRFVCITGVNLLSIFSNKFWFDTCKFSL